MSSDYGKELLRSGIIDAKAGNRESARRYLDRAAYMSSDHDVLAETWFWMSQVIDDKAEKRKAKLLKLKKAAAKLGYRLVKIRTRARNRQSRSPRATARGSSFPAARI